MIDERKLLEKLKQKDAHALEKAIGIYTPYLATVLYNMAGNRISKEDGEEVISDVFITLWKNAAYIDLEKGTVRAYISAVARNLALRRLNKNTDYTSLDDVVLYDETPVDEGLVAKELWDAVKSLGETDCEMFVRYYKYGEKIRTIAKVMGLNVSTVKTRLLRGKKKLKKLLTEEDI